MQVYWETVRQNEIESRLQRGLPVHAAGLDSGSTNLALAREMPQAEDQETSNRIHWPAQKHTPARSCQTIDFVGIAIKWLWFDMRQYPTRATP
jgi:hypothetical protein